MCLLFVCVGGGKLNVLLSFAIQSCVLSSNEKGSWWSVRLSGSEWMGIRAEYEAESIYCVLWQPIKVQSSLLFHAFPQNLITNMFMFSNIRSVQDLFHMRAKKLFDPKKVVTFGCFWCAHNRLWLQPGQSASSLFHNDQIQNSPPINIQHPCHGFSFLLKHLYFFGNQSDLSTLQECKINF